MTSDRKFQEVAFTAIMDKIQPKRRVDIPDALNAMGIPPNVDDPELTKREYVKSRLSLMSDDDWIKVTREFLDQYDEQISRDKRFELEELLWCFEGGVGLSVRARYEVARALEGTPLYRHRRHKAFISLLCRFWDRASPFEHMFQKESSLIKKVKQHFLANPDWNVEQLFENLGAFDCSDRRFALFIEGLVSSEVRPVVESQHQFVDTVNDALADTGIQLQEAGWEDGFPVFKFNRIGQSISQPKNLIFASLCKPDLRFSLNYS